MTLEMFVELVATVVLNFVNVYSIVVRGACKIFLTRRVLNIFTPLLNVEVCDFRKTFFAKVTNGDSSVVSSNNEVVTFG